MSIHTHFIDHGMRVVIFPRHMRHTYLQRAYTYILAVEAFTQPRERCSL